MNNKAARPAPGKPPFLATRWMLTLPEIIVIIGAVVLTLGGLVASVQVALQLERALNLNLTQTLIVSQGIVNLQREVLLTHDEVLRQLGGLDNPPEPITRNDFIDIQVTNLGLAAESPSIRSIFTDEDIAVVKDIQTRGASIDQLVADSRQADTPEERRAALQELDVQLGMLENIIKKLVDRQAIVQRDAIVQTRDALGASQSTSVVAGGVLLLMGIALVLVFRRSLSFRLQQAVEADQLKSRLLTSVSHELRTPINAIQGYSQLLGEEAYGSLTDKQQTTIRRILLNTTQLQGMVNNLLDRAQIEQGKLTLRNTAFVPADLIETTHAALNILAVTKGLELTSEIAPDVPPALTGDVQRLQQILFNLISNALKFTESGGVHTRIFLPDPADWALQVRDTGIGISTEAQAHVFAPFWQIDSSATRQYRGSGLGLSIVKQLADLMGGVITLVSQPGQGTTFTIVFPIEAQS